MKQMIEVTGKIFEYDDTASPSDNAAIKALFSLDVQELEDIISEFLSVIRYCGLEHRVEFYNCGTYFSVTGYIPDDVMYMFEEILGNYTNDVVDKLDYAIGDID